MSSARIRSSSVGAAPRPKPILVSRAESVCPTVPEVRCGCQFYQSDSLLPERINPIGSSRPESQTDYYVESISRPQSPQNRVVYSRADIIRPEPILIDPSAMEEPSSAYHFKPIRDSPPKWHSRDNNYMVYAEETSPVEPEVEERPSRRRLAVEEPHHGKRRSPSASSMQRDVSPLPEYARQHHNINASSQILRNRSRSTSFQGSVNSQTVGKIVKTVSFEFGAQNDQSGNAPPANKSANSTVKFDRGMLGLNRNYDIR